MSTWSVLTAMKKKYPDCMVLFRCGDFYECYEEDAEEAAKILGITCTRRKSKNGLYQFKMAGFPHHALDTYLPKLIRAGKRIVLCDGDYKPIETITPSEI